MSRLLVLLVFLVLVMLVAASCTQPAEQPPTPAATSVAKVPVAHPPAGAPVQAADVNGAMAKLRSSEVKMAVKINGKPMGVMEFKGANTRTEPPPTPRGKVAFIFNAAEKKTIMLMLDQKTAMEMPAMKGSYVEQNIPQSAVGAQAGVTWKKSADGKYWEGTSADGKKTMKIWLDGPGGLPSKMETTEGVQKNVMEWTYLKVGGIPDSDFTVPKDFKMSSMPGMPGTRMPAKPKK